MHQGIVLKCMCVHGIELKKKLKRENKRKNSEEDQQKVNTMAEEVMKKGRVIQIEAVYSNTPTYSHKHKGMDVR